MNLLIFSGWAYSAGFVRGAWPEAGVIPFNQEVPADGVEADVVLGWSLGGLRALQALHEGRLRTGGLVLVSSTARFCATDGYACGVARAALRAMSAGLRRQREATLAAFFRDAASPSALSEAEAADRIRQAGVFPDQELAAGLNALDTLDLREALSSCAVPVLILHGQLDRIIPVEAGAFLEERLDRAVRHVHPEAGHELMVRQAGWIAEQVAAFAAGL